MKRYLLAKLASVLKFCRFAQWSMSIYNYLDGKPDEDLKEDFRTFRLPHKTPKFHLYDYLCDVFYVDDKKLEYVVEYNQNEGWIKEQVPEWSSLIENFGQIKYHEKVHYGNLHIMKEVCLKQSGIPVRVFYQLETK